MGVLSGVGLHCTHNNSYNNILHCDLCVVCVCLSYRIWEHLVELVSTARTTIVITTHYIEEARQANIVKLLIVFLILIFRF